MHGDHRKPSMVATHGRPAATGVALDAAADAGSLVANHQYGQNDWLLLWAAHVLEALTMCAGDVIYSTFAAPSMG